MARTPAGDSPLHHTVTRGSGVPVVLLHGFGTSHHANWMRTGWDTALAGRTTVGPDLRGHGGSGRPHEHRAYLPEAMADDVVRLLDVLDIERADLVAYSMGSRLAWELALTRPDRVRRAVLGGFGPVDAFEGTDLNSPGSADTPFGRVFRAAAALPGADPAALAACARGQAARPFTASPAPRGVPLLFVAGERDDLARGVEELARATGAQAVRVAGRDHRTAVSAQAFKKSVVEFLGRGARADSDTPDLIG
ncbi:alpha/beta fold hydrolase [Nocardiopsis sediminis]|uniref:Alpha/beta fold hydrolase n=1 Tax=Nocardiopsis sediminis TaxID=1778267 RepID=A0ABV8FKG2_9ACTN